MAISTRLKHTCCHKMDLIKRDSLFVCLAKKLSLEYPNHILCLVLTLIPIINCFLLLSSIFRCIFWTSKIFKLSPFIFEIFEPAFYLYFISRSLIATFFQDDEGSLMYGQLEQDCSGLWCPYRSQHSSNIKYFNYSHTYISNSVSHMS